MDHKQNAGLPQEYFEGTAGDYMISFLSKQGFDALDAVLSCDNRDRMHVAEIINVNERESERLREGLSPEPATSYAIWEVAGVDNQQSPLDDRPAHPPFCHDAILWRDADGKAVLYVAQVRELTLPHLRILMEFAGVFPELEPRIEALGRHNFEVVYRRAPEKYVEEWFEERQENAVWETSSTLGEDPNCDDIDHCTAKLIYAVPNLPWRGTKLIERQELCSAADMQLPAKSILDPVANTDVDFDNGKPKNVPLPIGTILGRIYATTSEWPRSVNGTLFYDDAVYGICRFSKPCELFGWLSSVTGPIAWKRLDGCVSKEELFAEAKRTAKNYLAIESNPHFPPIPGHYYRHPVYQPGNGSTLSALLDRFCPASEVDRNLILAMIASAAWGGPGGTRPAFVITADAGHGAGKSRLVELVSQIFGDEPFRIKQGESGEEIAKRILTPGTEGRRFTLLDNAKTERLSWGDVEAFITARTIGGRQMYTGESSRPNSLVWCFTLNGPAMSRDMAQRSVIIKLRRPTHEGRWEHDTRAFIESNRDAIFSDLAAFFQLEEAKLRSHSRWAEWEQAIISRLPAPHSIQAVIQERQLGVDADREDSSAIEDHFESELEGLGVDPAVAVVHIANEVARGWYSRALGLQKLTTTSMTRAVNQAVGEGRLRRLAVNPHHGHGRGLVWRGGDSLADDDVDYQIVSSMLRERRMMGQRF